MKLSNKDLQKIYFGAYNFAKTQDGYLQAFQYTAEQIAYFKEAFEFWYERCTASTSKTIEIRTNAKKISFDYTDGMHDVVIKNFEIDSEYSPAKKGTKVLYLPEYFLDNLHPNALGTEVYGRYLVEKICELKF